MPWEYIIVHHTGAEEKDASQVRRYHLSLGWRDVGYNYLLERDGRVVTGRSLDVPGAHCSSGGMNRLGIGVALIGNLENHPPTRRQVEELPVLLRHLMAQHNIPVERVLGHREVPGAATVCPGRYLDMHALRRKLAAAQGMPETGNLVLREERAVLEVHEQTAGDIKVTTTLGSKDSLRYVPEPVGPVVWRVLSGLFNTKKEAEHRARQLQQMGIEAVVVPPD